jgi:hypothetical protein
MAARAGCVVAVSFAAVGPAHAAFPQSPPNDPDYAVNPACQRGSGQFWLLSTIPPQCRFATDPENAAGMSVDAAWKRFTTGRPDTLVSYTEGGINWRQASGKDIVNRTFLNTGELPLPVGAGGSACSAYDCNADGRVNVADYAEDPRITRPFINGYLTPEDLVVAFGHCRISNGALGDCPKGGRFDNDHNGFPNDVSGWDFVHHSNDVQTDWTGYTHANGQAATLAGEADNGLDGAGVCPDCTVIFIKGGDEAITAPSRQALATIYAATIGVDVVTRESVSLGQSPFQRRTFQAALRRGIVTSDDASDFDSNSHTEGMLLDDDLPGNSLVESGPTPATVATFRNRSSVTSWGPHAVLSVPTIGGSTSEATPVQGGLLALIAAEGKRQGAKLTPAEIMQLAIASASRIDDPDLPWPGRPDASWSGYYGYGRPNAERALEMIGAGRIPPIADINSPSWYARFDPVRDRRRVLAIRGSVSARRAPSARYSLQYALGPEPADDAFKTLKEGSFSGARKGVLAKLALARIPVSFAQRAYANSGARTPGDHNGYEPYAVTLRLVVTDANGLTGVDRQVFYAQHDPDRLAGFPKRIGSSGEAQPVLADLDGDRRNEIVLPTSDGRVHAFTRRGRELRGWPVRTRQAPDVRRYRANPLLRRLGIPRDPIIASAAVGDLDRDGRLEVVAITTGAYLYVWEPDGHLRRGFPVLLTRHSKYPVPSPAISGHSPVTGAGAHPVLADLDGDKRLEIIQGTTEKAVFVIRADGTTLPGWPVTLTYPEDRRPAPSFTGPVIVASPAVGDIDGDGTPEVVVGSQDTIQEAKPGPAARPLYAIKAEGNKAEGGPYLSGWPTLLPDTLAGITAGIDFVVQANSSPVIVDADGDDRPDVVASTSFGTPAAFDGAGQTIRSYAAEGDGGRGPEPVLTFTTSATPARVGDGMQLVSPGSSLVPLVANAIGVSVPATSVQASGAVYNFERSWDLATGDAAAGYPRVQQGLAFFGAPSIADVDGDGRPEALQLTDSFILHAFHLDADGEAAGFPKFTGGWGTYSPAVGDINGDRRPDVVVATREGYLDAFAGHGRAKDAQWCAFAGSALHDGRYRGRCSIPHSRRKPR